MNKHLDEDDPNFPDPEDDDDDLDDNVNEEDFEDTDADAEELQPADGEEPCFEVIDDAENLDPDDIKALNKHWKTIEKNLAKQNKSKKSFVKQRNELVKEVKKLIKDIDILILGEAFKRRMTATGFLNEHDKLRKGLLKALLNTMDPDAKIIIVKELLAELSDDDEPAEYYIG